MPVREEGTQNHYFTLETDFNAAWIEGFAQFFLAIAHDYLYANYDFDFEGDRSVDPPSMLLDDRWSDLPTSGDRRRVEGAVACFLYSLLDDAGSRGTTDDPTQEMITYVGDNDDVSLSAADFVYAVQNIPYIMFRPIEDFYVWLLILYQFPAPENGPINTLYKHLIERDPRPPYSATPASVLASSASASEMSSVLLNFEDPSVPSPDWGFFSFCVESFTIDRNLRQGFTVYRRQTSQPWDGSLNGYSIVDTIVAPTEVGPVEWLDSNPLELPASYVVVAHNNEYVSTPRAEAKIVPPTSLTSPVMNETVSDVVSIQGSVRQLSEIAGFDYQSDISAIVVEWAEAQSPSTWSDYGISLTCGACPVDESEVATWNTGVVPAGDYTLRVVATYGQDTFTSTRAVTVTHKSIAVDLNASGGITSIQAGIDSSEMGDTILVFPPGGTGQYDEDVVMKETVHLVGVGGAVPIVGTGTTGSSSAVTIKDHDYPCVIDGFDISHEDGGSQYTGRGVFIENASPIVSNCTIQNNKTDTGEMGAGVFIIGDSSPEFLGCVIRDNEGRGAALALRGIGQAMPVASFTNCEIKGNQLPLGSTGVINIAYDTPLDISSEQPEFIDCLIEGNDASTYGAVVFLGGCHAAVFEGCSFVANTVVDGMGLIAADGSGARITNCTIVDNDCIFVFDAYALGPGVSTSIEKTIIAYNTGPAVYDQAAWQHSDRG